MENNRVNNTKTSKKWNRTKRNKRCFKQLLPAGCLGTIFGSSFFWCFFWIYFNDTKTDTYQHKRLVRQLVIHFLENYWWVWLQKIRTTHVHQLIKNDLTIPVTSFHTSISCKSNWIFDLKSVLVPILKLEIERLRKSYISWLLFLI